MDPISATVLFGAVSGGFGLILWAARKGRLLTEKSWQATATALDGEYVPVGGPWYQRTPMEVRANIKSVRVIADSYVVSTGKSSITYTRVVAKPVHAGVVRLEVHPRTLPSSVGKLFGAQDVDVGRPELEQYIIKAGDEQIARAWISPSVARAVVAAAPYWFAIEGGRAKLVRVGLEGDTDRLARAMKAAATFAARGKKLAVEWSKLAGALGGTLREEMHLVDHACEGAIMVLRHACEVTISFLRVDDRTVTAVSAQRQDPSGRMMILPAAAEAPPKLTRVTSGDAAFDEAFVTLVDEAGKDARPIADVRDKLLAATPMRATIQGTKIEVLLDGIVLDASRIDAAVEAAAMLAATTATGPYR